MNHPYDQLDFNLKPLEIKIVNYILRKKQFDGFENPHYSIKFFEKARKTKLKKKNEDGLKFIFKRAIKQLKFDIKKKLKSENEKLSIDEFDKRFYTYYYGKISEKMKKPLECFYHFRNWKKRTSPNIPKSVTKKYLALLKKNPEFIQKINNFLLNDFFLSFYRSNSNKIRHLIIKWEEMIQNSPDNWSGIEKIKKSILGKGNKLPWTLSEAECAFKKTLDSIKKA
jgi:hypothetical protein